MDSAAEDILFQKIDELVLDEDRIVTYSVLCENLEICLADAKLILEKYVSDQLSPGKISVTYILCGRLKTGGYGIQIAESALLKEKKKLFEKVGNEVVYSIQKSNKIDFNLIAAVEYESKNALKGSIVGEKCKERALKTKVLPPLPPQKNFEKQKPSFFKPVSKPQCSGDIEKIKTEPITVKNNAKTQKLTSQNNKKSSSLTNFLSQSTQNESKNNNSEHNSSKESSVDMEDVKTTSNVKIEESNEVIKNNDEKENVNLKKNGDVQQQKRKKSAIDKTSNKVVKKEKADETKKRKRIIMDSDSDDDLFGNNEDERMVLEESDEEQAVVKPTPSIAVPKNKRRKAVEKTYEDEEGFIVTKTEYVLMSASEDEELEIPKKTEAPKIIKTDLKEENKSSSVPKTASKKKGKVLPANQSSITNFFKKK
ncbi:hypothetical protein WA026_023752 [Henosepilachna vigintioctopunctata]|uniref:DNA polymerase delta subunit 3 n=1 Tax=Henosepilachna vigintioctopunctata TaxID=420089 RepID=A0AAW1U519_9CUCU